MRTRVVGIAAGIVSWVGLALAVVLVVHVVLTVGGANPDNPITSTVKAVAEPLALAFRDLFTPADAKLRVLVNFGLAALFWLVVRAIVLRLVRRLD
ncbi:YggT family protein [Lentzea flava]|uniref:YGGT family protein n=1 Tax=Lentzea flava TaxID=103732 RepID=A0ABQ2UQL5_9PSEU|nr:YggT family protein [Lentzea flava]MCP2201325.1 YGGT family protein [Lentzea flava]GGU49051.1 hypothetical protein GCM10010178_47190 [Lentzea flava]